MAATIVRRAACCIAAHHRFMVIHEWYRQTNAWIDDICKYDDGYQIMKQTTQFSINWKAERGPVKNIWYLKLNLTVDYCCTLKIKMKTKKIEKFCKKYKKLQKWWKKNTLNRYRIKEFTVNNNWRSAILCNNKNKFLLVLERPEICLKCEGATLSCSHFRKFKMKCNGIACVATQQIY